MTNAREIMAAAIGSKVWQEDWDGGTQDPADACLAALTAAGFAVQRRVDREALRERIADVIWKSNEFSDGYIEAGYLADAVLAVLDTPTEEGNG